MRSPSFNTYDRKDVDTVSNTELRSTDSVLLRTVLFGKQDLHESYVDGIHETDQSLRRRR